jgi:cell division protein FtsQ
MPSGSRMVKVLLLVFWIALSIGALTLLVAAIETRNAKPCNGYHITITGAKESYFVDQKDVLRILGSVTGNIKGKPLKEFDLKKMEDALERNPWIGNAELYFDNTRTLEVKVEEKDPVARIFTSTGTSYYIDSSMFRMPLNEKFTPRLPVFTNFPVDKKILKGKDSALMGEVRDISLFLLNDPFWMAQIDQVDINADRQFEMVPKVGNHKVVFGDGDGIDQKFRKLYIFYNDVLSKTGWNRYSMVNISYKNQVVATRKDVKAIRADTLLARQWVKQMIRNTKDEALADSSKSRLGSPQPAEATDKNKKPKAVMQPVVKDKNVTTTSIKEQL